MAILMSSNSVEKAGGKIKIICYKYQDQVDRRIERNEIILFASFAEHLQPEIHAAGFFRVNQDMLSSLLTALFTYMIVIIQFNMSF